MGIWQLTFWAIVAGVALIVLAGLALTLFFRIYWSERRRHYAEMGQMIQAAAREAKEARGGGNNGSV